MKSEMETKVGDLLVQVQQRIEEVVGGTPDHLELICIESALINCIEAIKES